MLIIGDVATRKYNPDHKVNVVEILYHDREELQYIINKYELKNVRFNAVYTQEFKEGPITYRLYSKNITPILGKILRDSFAGKLQTKVANPFFNFIFDTIKVVQQHKDFDTWEHNMKSYSFFVKNHIEDLVRFNPKFDIQIERYHRLLRKLPINQTNFLLGPYEYSPYIYVSQSELLSIVSNTMVNMSPFYKIVTDELGGISEKAFDKLLYREQITACVECLYIDVLNEYAIPQIQDTRITPSSQAVKRAFKKAIMNRASQRIDDWFGIFMVNNYKDIMGRYHNSYYNCFLNAIKVGEISISSTKDESATGETLKVNYKLN